MADPSTIGLDIAKNVFQVHGIDDAEAVVAKRKLQRRQLVDYFRGTGPCLVGIEACSGAHHWARSLEDLGHQVKLISPAFVKPYVKSQKNDAADAEAICEAVRRPTMRFVPVKSEEQQAVLMLHRTRELLIRARSKLINAFRGHLAEFGRVERRGPVGLSMLLKLDDDPDLARLPPAARLSLETLLAEFRSLDIKVDELDGAIQIWHRANPLSLKLATIPGIGPLTASALVVTVADPDAFRSGRQLAAWIGLVPRQRSSGGVTKLGKITRTGNRYLRRLLVTGAHNVLATAIAGRTSVSPSIAALLVRKPHLVVAVALANKMARTAWALMSRGEEYIPRATVRLGPCN